MVVIDLSGFFLGAETWGFSLRFPDHGSEFAMPDRRGPVEAINRRIQVTYGVDAKSVHLSVIHPPSPIEQKLN
ncbi:MAG: hypothetical protein N0E59_00890 [Candidatus Thiodiazotropha taylori]|nr:hypothetical protein [Candidatus Thiodiazotropha taylori]MCW4281635.1 hypothetical protein [Candidatus Thiodiazotropha taylori]